MTYNFYRVVCVFLTAYDQGRYKKFSKFFVSDKAHYINEMILISKLDD